MFEISAKPEAVNIKKLLSSGHYIVPLYQRNYAWKRQEIRQFLDDIWNKSEEDNSSDYYIGTLVLDQKSEGKLEIIDGQQRFSTITVIDAVLKDRLPLKSIFSALALQPVIDFDARGDVRKYLTQLYNDYDIARNYNGDNQEVKNFYAAVKYVEEFLNDLSKDAETTAISRFADYFYNNVKIIRINVPPHTDINHYFEIMNNRGEQLEKHEVLKAKLLFKLGPVDPRLRKTYAAIWDACSEMDRHVISCLEPTLRKNICGYDFSKVPKAFLKIDDFSSTESEDVNVSDFSLEKILTLDSGNLKKESLGGAEIRARFKSIIDFPNFLLQVLKLDFEETTTSGNVKGKSLDDKKLLTEFGYPDNLPDPVKFINALLYYRLLFDRYIIKREEGNDDWSWNLSKPVSYSKGDLGFVNTFGTGNLDDIDESPDYRDIIMLQSMFHVTFPGNNYKDWLQRLLIFFREKGQSFTASELHFEILKMAEQRLRMDEKFDKFSGVATPRFVFNYLDYLIWKNSDALKLSEKAKAMVSKFRFTQNNSVEHMHPQRHVEDLNTLDEPYFQDKRMILNHFGNLCLISHGSNSRYSDFNYAAKKLQFEKSSAVESLKQVLMFEYQKWTSKEIKDHGDAMLALISQSISK